MKAITLQQPWASLVVLGAKSYETRSWPTSHRGMLLIHAGRAFPQTQRKLAGSEPFRSALARGGIEAPDDLPLGALLGAVTVSACRPAAKVKPGPMELAFGDFGPGRWAWKLSDPCRLPNPISYKGNRGIFDVPDDFCRQSGVPIADISLAARVGRWFGLNI